MTMDNNMVEEKFRQWTAGLDQMSARIALFENIRDIPYEIIPELRDPVRGPSRMLEIGRGSCVPKHWLLCYYFKKMGLKVKYATYPFRWHNSRVKYPFDIKILLKDLPINYHLACKVFIDGKWKLVDATMDPGVETAGFRINNFWDGECDTKNAVDPLEEVLHDTPEDRVAYEAERKSIYTDSEKSATAEFVPKLNAWLMLVRKSSAI